jgi:uncharacterized membrane protein
MSDAKYVGMQLGKLEAMARAADALRRTVVQAAHTGRDMLHTIKHIEGQLSEFAGEHLTDDDRKDLKRSLRRLRQDLLFVEQVFSE